MLICRQKAPDCYGVFSTENDVHIKLMFSFRGRGGDSEGLVPNQTLVSKGLLDRKTTLLLTKQPLFLLLKI